MLFVDIDGCLVNCEIQKYVSQIALFGNEPIRDLEYIIKCVEYMLERAKRLNYSQHEIDFIENRVLPFTKNNLYERLKESRDCFLEYDNYISALDRQKYINEYQSDSIIPSLSDVTDIMEYLKHALMLAYRLIKYECHRAKLEHVKPNLPFAIVNDDNDIIINESIDGINVNDIMYKTPVERALSAMNRIFEIEKNYQTSNNDDFLVATKIVGGRHIVNYDNIYTLNNLMLGSRETLRASLVNGMFDEIIALSHHTGERESFAKKRLLTLSFPFVGMDDESLLKYHTEKAQMGVRRSRSSKAERAKAIMKKIKGIASIEGCYLIDDSAENLEVWAEAGGKAILYRPRKKDEIATGIDKPIDSRFVRMFNWSVEEMERVLSCFDKKDNKVLIKK